MGQKVNPISLRLQQTNREFDNCWYTNYFYRKLVSRDIYLQQYINSFLKLLKCPSARFSIQYTPKNIKLSSFLCYPKQSRELRSRMFGLVFSKKRKNISKKISSKNSIFGKHSFSLINKKQTSRFSKRHKTLKFLVDNRLWSRVYNPFIFTIKKNEKRGSAFFYNEKQPFCIQFQNLENFGKSKNSNLVQNSIISPKFKNYCKNSNLVQKFLFSPKFKNYCKNSNFCTGSERTGAHVQNLVNFEMVPKFSKFWTGQNFIKKPGHFLLPLVSKESFHKTKHQTISIPIPYKNQTEHKKTLSKFQNLGQSEKIIKQLNKKKNSQLFYFIKNLITNLFFIKIFKKSRDSNPFQKQKFLDQSKNDGLIKNLSRIPKFYFNLEYRKNFLKYFLVFYLLHRQYNKNTLFVQYCPKFTKFWNQCKNTNFCNKISIFRSNDNLVQNSRINPKTKVGPNFNKILQKFEFLHWNGMVPKLQILDSNNLKNFETDFSSVLQNSMLCFSNFQSISIFNTTLDNTKPFNYLVQNLLNLGTQHNPSGFSIKKKNSNHFPIDFLQGKKLDNELVQYLANFGNLNSLVYSKEKKKTLFYYVKKNQLQDLKYKNYVQHFLCSQYKLNTEFLPFVVSQDWQSAGFLADEIVYFLERRVTFRRLKKKIIKKMAENSTIRGVRISCSGRVGGKSKKAQRAKTECVKYGQTSRHTFSSRIDFAVRTARTVFGSVGIKVWISYN